MHYGGNITVEGEIMHEPNTVYREILATAQRDVKDYIPAEQSLLKTIVKVMHAWPTVYQCRALLPQRTHPGQCLRG